MKTGSVSRFIFAISIGIAALSASRIEIIMVAIVFAVLALMIWTREPKNILAPVRLIILFFSFIFLLHLFSHKGEVLFSVISLKATVQGAQAGLFYGLKLVVFIFSAYLILKSVEPFELVRPVERLSRILGRKGKPLSFMALAFSLALRFIPDLARQGRLTMMAINTRGISFDGGIANRLNAAVHLIAVVFVNSFKSAESAALALSVKGYSTRYMKAVFPPARITYGGVLTLAFSAVFIVFGWRF